MSKRAAIIQLHRAGHSNSKIMKLLKAPKSTVCDTILRFQELGTMEDRDRSGRPRSARTPAKIKALRERIRRNPKRSLRKTAKDMNISHESVRTIVEQDLKMSPYKIRTRQLLTDLQKRKRKERAKILLNRLKGGTEKGEIVFSDENSSRWRRSSTPRMTGFSESCPRTSLIIFDLFHADRNPRL